MQASESTTITPPPSAETPFRETADIETSSDGYARRFAGPTGRWMLAVQEERTRALLRPYGPGRSILDVGGGHGQLAIPFCREGHRVTVLGSAPECSTRIREAVEHGTCRFCVGNVISLPFPDRSFDLAISFRLLTHCGRWPALVAELCRVARRAVIVDYPTSQSVNRLAPRLFAAKKKLEGDTRTWKLFTHAEVREVFADQGFRESQRYKQFFLPMVAHRMLKCRPLSAGLEALARAAGLTRLAGSPVIGCYEPVGSGRDTR
ncbi:MAG: methyltransferase domain-containing protein [Candidatus Erginobacter occultus]|nr:methyltransferase domain-containing protein [Candidatus Erginobacter occultus]